jgi:hypothetical protein
VPEQQPWHDSESQMQAPETQRSPAPQFAIVPQTQAWLTHESPPRLAQTAHCAPPVPQAFASVPATQVLPEQHPAGQLVASQTQLPPEHTVPGPQAGLLPHWQPLGPQVSVTVVSQALHATPPRPHWVTSPGLRHALPWQHPAQVVVSQTHAPLWQWRPAPQGALVPHWQLPEAQLSALFALHAVQVPPTLPQAVKSLPVLQVLLRQQPPVQLFAVQTQVLVRHEVPAPHSGDEPHLH